MERKEKANVTFLKESGSMVKLIELQFKKMHFYTITLLKIQIAIEWFKLQTSIYVLIEIVD